jgi:hypothetical protein
MKDNLTTPVYRQKKNKTEISIDIRETELVYGIKDESISRKEAIPFEQILTSRYEVFEQNKSFKNNAVYTAVLGTLFLSINIFYGAQLWAWLFLVAAPIFYFLYHRSKAAFTVIKTTGDLNLFILQDKQHAEILKNIYKARNDHFIHNYLEINYENDPVEELDKFSWLKEQGVITERELQVIQEEILNHRN